MKNLIATYTLSYVNIVLLVFYLYIFKLSFMNKVEP